MKNKKEKTYSVFLYKDGEEISYMEMKSEHLADVMMAARGWLMVSHVSDKVEVYDDEGFDVAAYIK